MAAVRHIGFLKAGIFNIDRVGRANLRHRTKFRGFLHFWNFNGHNAYQGQTASQCQMLTKWVKLWPRYVDFSIFQDGGRRHLGFLKFQAFNGRTAQEDRNVPQCEIWTTAAEIGDFSIFQDSCRRHLGFSKFQTVNGRTAQEGRNALPCQLNWVEIGQTAAEIWQFFDFSRRRPQPSCIFKFLKF